MTTYTDAMVATLKEAAPLNLDKAHKLAGDLGVSYRSIIAKASQLGIEYQKKAPAAKRGTDAPKKADLVTALEAKFGRELPGIDRAPVTVLEILLEV